MPSAIALKGILRADGIRLRRDRFLLGITVYLLAVSLAMRWAVPWITSGAEARWGFDLAPYHALLMSWVLVQLAPQLVGILGAFLLLEAKEDRMVKAQLVAPVPLGSYLWVVGSVMLGAAAVLIVVEAAIIGIALPPWPALLGIAVAGAPAAGGFAFFTAAVAQDKTQAMAYLKILGNAPFVATGAYFVAEPWQWLAGVYPPYWAVKAYWVAEAGSDAWPIWVLGGLLMSALWLVALVRMYTRAARR